MYIALWIVMLVVGIFIGAVVMSLIMALGILLERERSEWYLTTKLPHSPLREDLAADGDEVYRVERKDAVGK